MRISTMVDKMQLEEYEKLRQMKEAAAQGSPPLGQREGTSRVPALSALVVLRQIVMETEKELDRLTSADPSGMTAEQLVEAELEILRQNQKVQATKEEYAV